MLFVRTHVRIYVCTYARPIFHPISVQDSDVVDGGKEGGREHHRPRGKLESRSDSPVIAPLNRNTAAIRSHPSLPFPHSFLLSPSPSSSFRSLSESERSTFFSFLLPFPRTLPGTYAVCKSRRECVSVRITNRKRFSYLPFIKRNEHVRIDIRPISVYLGALLRSPVTYAERFLHQRAPRSSFTCA